MAAARMHFDLTPVQDKRLFRHGVRYDEINWADRAEAVDNLRQKFNDWYVGPIRALLADGRHGFAATSLICTLIDSLSLYRAGEQESSKSLFIEFARDHLSFFGDGTGAYATLPVPVQYTDGNGNSQMLQTYASLLYSCFRCGIVHGACVPLCGALAGDPDHGSVFRHNTDCAKDAGGSDAPTYLLDPNLLFQELITYMPGYWQLAVSDADLATKFDAKFRHDYGIHVGV